ncbi:MAG TPA: serine hydrolase [Candidatus Limnocylindrales bacterium]|nr:serine hydrolase [Candidatus Limnocylindrales bacterium]
MGRLPLSLALTVLLAAGPPPTAALASRGEMAGEMAALLRAFPGRVGLWIAEPGADALLYASHEDAVFGAASLYKLAVLLEVERRVDAGLLDYGDRLTIEPSDITPSPSWLSAGATVTVDEALELMITVSDNATAVHFLRTLGPAAIGRALAEASIPGFHVTMAAGDEMTVTARGVGTFFTLLARGELVSPEASDRMLARLARQTVSDRLPAALPDHVLVAHKTGNLPGLAHDAGIVVSVQGPRVVVALTAGARDPEATAFIARLGAVVYSAEIDGHGLAMLPATSVRPAHAPPCGALGSCFTEGP